jgi:hypothetical protein
VTPRQVAAVLLVGFYLACLAFGPTGALPAGAALLPPSLAHPLGTDELGRDMLLALLQAGRGSLLVAAVATLVALLLGAAVGVLAAIAPPLLDEALMRLAEVVSSRCWRANTSVRPGRWARRRGRWRGAICCRTWQRRCWPVPASSSVARFWRRRRSPSSGWATRRLAVGGA